MRLAREFLGARARAAANLKFLTFFLHFIRASVTTAAWLKWRTTLVKTYTTPTTVMFETLDLDAGGSWLHKALINKEQEKVEVPLERP